MPRRPWISIDRLPQTANKGAHLKQRLKDKLLERKLHIDKHGQHLPEVRNWNRGAMNAVALMPVGRSWRVITWSTRAPVGPFPSTSRVAIMGRIPTVAG